MEGHYDIVDLKISKVELDKGIVEEVIKSNKRSYFPIVKDELVIVCGGGPSFS